MSRYLRKRGKEESIIRIARFRLGSEMREGRYWEAEEKRRCRLCGWELQSWEHVVYGKEQRRRKGENNKNFARRRERRGLDEKTANQKETEGARERGGRGRDRNGQRQTDDERKYE